MINLSEPLAVLAKRPPWDPIDAALGIQPGVDGVATDHACGSEE
jgi:hypothetical protein